ncbi:double-stranded RNA binding motif domain-containing protein [Tengunoibacter tsumagoiensis]|uniref:DRBM domain-containing protein n=1 Tax=Tengunoibacter tsumagoiensis TaxID=2014871 RepID=A0A402A677_9CHLR|nr:double-stranded RNA binding motif domain-containing protein [Tengunoibacter tsumagoiensis]GCE14632.1 hypothetical protein KTT_44910 [Tengunoibacter tsumagoiensis]
MEIEKTGDNQNVFHDRGFYYELRRNIQERRLAEHITNCLNLIGDKVLERTNKTLLDLFHKHSANALIFLLAGVQYERWQAPSYYIKHHPGEDFQVIAITKKDDKVCQSIINSAPQKEQAKLLAAIDLFQRLMKDDLQIKTEEHLLVFEQEGWREDVPAQENAKGKLYELIAQRKGEVDYRTLQMINPIHRPLFLIECEIVVNNDTLIAKGLGLTKKEADHHAADQLLQALSQINTSLVRPSNSADNPISILNEMKQRGKIQAVSYTYNEQGTPQDRSFSCLCSVTTLQGTVMSTSGNEASKKAATRSAAQQMITALSL